MHSDNKVLKRIRTSINKDFYISLHSNIIAMLVSISEFRAAFTFIVKSNIKV